MKKIISTFLALVMTLSTFSYVCAEEDESSTTMLEPATLTFELYYFIETDGTILTKEDLPTVENIDVSEYYPNAIFTTANAPLFITSDLEEKISGIGENWYYFKYYFEVNFGTDLYNNHINFDTPYPYESFAAVTDELSEIPFVSNISLFAKGYETIDFSSTDTGSVAGYYDYYGDEIADPTPYPLDYAFENADVVFEKSFEPLRYGYVCDSETLGIGDVILLSKHVSKKLTLPADSQNYKNANCDLRDSAVNADDLKAMIDYLLGTIDSLPVRG
jgi:hypothetical protein